jgi:hypothetical protein
MAILGDVMIICAAIYFSARPRVSLGQESDENQKGN